MKKAMFIAALFIAATSFGQTKSDTAKVEPVKKDTTIQLLMPLAQYRALLYTIDQNVDSKSKSKELLDFLQRSAMIYQPEEKKPTTKQKQ